jgi:uncharacterized tellurite resistance protein B-like protein
MTIWGSKARMSAEGGGRFFCPHCDVERAYFDQKVQTYFTMLYVPVFKVGKSSGFIECKTCKSTYAREVLSYDPERDDREFQAHFERAVLDVMILMMISDGAIDEQEVSTIVRVHHQLAGMAVSEDRIRARALEVQAESGSLQTYVANVAGHLNPDGKDMVLRALTMIAAADGVIAPEELAVLKDAGKALDIPRARIDAAINDLQPR